MAKTRCRFHLSHLEVIRGDGTTIRVPWSDVLAGHESSDSVVSFARRVRRENAVLPSGICVGTRAAAIARRLRRRQEWPRLDQSLKCPTVARIFARFGTLALGMLTMMLAGMSPLFRRAFGGAGADQLVMPSEVEEVQIVVAALWIVCAVVMASVPLALAWPHLLFRLRHPQITGLQMRSDALIERRRDGSETVLPWRDVVRFDGAGLLEFAGRPAHTVRTYVFSNPVWRDLHARLKSKRRAAYMTPSNAQKVMRAIRALAIAAVAAELLLPLLLRKLGAEPSPPGRFVGYAALLAASLAAVACVHRNRQTAFGHQRLSGGPNPAQQGIPATSDGDPQTEHGASVTDHPRRRRYHSFRARQWSYLAASALGIGVAICIGTRFRGYFAGEAVNGNMLVLVALTFIFAIVGLQNRLLRERPPADIVNRAEATWGLTLMAGLFSLGFGLFSSAVIMLAAWRKGGPSYLSEISEAVVSTLVCLVAGTILLSLHPWARRRLRAVKGLCLKCGYDLTGNVSGRCPECGTATARCPASGEEHSGD